MMGRLVMAVRLFRIRLVMMAMTRPMSMAGTVTVAGTMTVARRSWSAGFTAGLECDLDHDRTTFNKIANGFSRFFFRGDSGCNVCFSQHGNGIAIRCGDNGPGGQHTQASVSPIRLVYRPSYIPKRCNSMP